MNQANPLLQLKKLVLPLALFSLVTNFAVLISPIYMMQVLDRVVPSGNLATLALLLTVALGFLLLQGVVEACRDSTFARVKRWVEAVGARLALDLGGDDRQTAINYVGTLGNFFSGSLATTALNMPWIPLFLVALTLIHPFFLALVGAIIALLWGISSAGRFLIDDHISRAQAIGGQEQDTLANAADPQLVAGIRAIGDNLATRFFAQQAERHRTEARASDIAAMKSGSETVLRTAAQLLALSLGAYLVTQGALTAGGMIGASIITAKTIGTIEASMTNFADIRSAGAAWLALGRQFQGGTPAQTEVADLTGALSANGLIFPRGGGAPPRLERITLTVEPGECMAIVGDSGSGKTTLLHALCGIDPAPIGSVFLDQSETRTLGPGTVASQIGYLPQQARLVRGTLAENISCFAESPEDTKIINAARTAGVHGLIS
ncbi:MAG: ATP-binding cassette domain-containing protein, partial [Pseudomonadota bacterium]